MNKSGSNCSSMVRTGAVLLFIIVITLIAVDFEQPDKRISLFVSKQRFKFNPRSCPYAGSESKALSALIQLTQLYTHTVPDGITLVRCVCSVLDAL